MSTFDYIHIGILVATILAILAGPILAVEITRKRDLVRETKERKLKIFRDIMGTRGVRMDPSHVAALNVVEIEFYEDPSVLAAYRAYMKHLRSRSSSEDAQQSFYDERDDLFLDLIKFMGAHLGYNFDKRELQTTAYAPEGWFDDQDLTRANAIRVGALLDGKRPLNIVVRSLEE